MSESSNRLIMLELRETTKPMHDATEQHRFQGLLAHGKLQPSSYQLYLQQLFIIHKKLAELLNTGKDVSPIISSVVKDRHTNLTALADDLAHFNIAGADCRALESTEQFIKAIELKSKDTPESLLGVLYVLEGSTHGAKYMASSLRTGLKLKDRDGSSYFDRYQEDQMPYWLDFKKTMNDQSLNERGREELVSLAIATFEVFSKIGTEILDQEEKLAKNTK